MTNKIRWAVFLGALVLSFAVGCQDATQPPVEASLAPFPDFKGYYVKLLNTSDSATISGIKVTYTSASGDSVTYDFGMLPAGQSVTLDPSDVNWTVERGQTISVSASGYLSKSLDTDVLIK